MNNKYAIMCKGAIVGYISENLCKKQNLSDETINLICETHSTKCGLLEDMENTDDKQELRALALQVEEIEFALQRMWGFTEDRNYHRWWEVPKCLCPHWDNRDNYGTPYRIINKECPVHGG
jgi:hypothetical protein